MGAGKRTFGKGAMTPDEIRAELSAAKRAHEDWKARLMSEIDKDAQTAMDPAKACNDTACVFGQFLASAPLEPWVTDRKPYEVITRLHRDFHAQAGEVLRLAQAGDRPAARAHLQGPYREASKKLLMAINKWDKELAQLYGRRADDQPAARRGATSWPKNR